MNSDALFSLADAVWQFAPRRLKVAHQHASSQPQLQSKTVPEGASVPESISAFFAQFQKVTDDLRARNEPIWKMQQYLLQQLASAKLAAFGVMTKPDVGHDRQLIPPFVFDNSPNVNWAKNTIENVGHRFEAVKIGRGLQRNTASAGTLHKSPPEKGRPSKSAEIGKAINGLLAEGIDLKNMERRIAYDSIRKYARDKLKANIKNGYSNPVLQRALYRRFGTRS